MGLEGLFPRWLAHRDGKSVLPFGKRFQFLATWILHGTCLNILRMEQWLSLEEVIQQSVEEAAVVFTNKPAISAISCVL